MADPDIPAGTEFVTMTERAAIREGMSEEMRRDPNVYLMGEEVAQYQGAYKISQGMLDELGADRVIDKIGRAHVELQSLMRISYAVFCMTTTNIKKTLNNMKTHRI